MRETVIPIRRMIQLVCLVFLVLSLTIYGTAQYFAGIYYDEKIKAVTANNDDLDAILSEMQTRISTLKNQIDVIVEKDKALRLYANLPEIDQDIRKMGMGGRVTRELNLNNLEDDKKAAFETMDLNLKALSQTVKLELMSYEALFETLQAQKDRLESIPSISPTKIGYVSSHYGYRRDPFNGERTFHQGIDIACKSGTHTYATAGGRVVYARYNGGYGYTVKIEHGYGYSTIYAHLSRMNVQKGQTVRRGELIGYVGNSGRSTGPHLHYEVRYNNNPMNPIEYIWTDESL
ncbi:MAG: M23 family metallopeptidase [Candidatus Marinimicrobia bacterium]|nr:M23 family metallopeptidase [Candidatus Neomarinimicrobiota bacterium]MDD5581684.1 M23 family metallopeptidase [Candidatus Neomarinimicrobiota bacterium]